MKFKSVREIKKAFNLKTKELKISERLSLLFFEIGKEAYYIKIET